MNQVAEQMIDEFFLNCIILSPKEYKNKSNILLNVVQDSLQCLQQEQNVIVAMKMVQKRTIKSVTKKFITEIIQESTDAIYRFEDDSISLADQILRDVLEREIKNLVKDVTGGSEVTEELKSIQNQDISMDFAEMDDVGEFGEFAETTDLHDVPNEHNYPLEHHALSNQSGISNASHPESYQISLQQREQLEGQLKMRQQYLDDDFNSVDDMPMESPSSRAQGRESLHSSQRSFSLVSLNES